MTKQQKYKYTSNLASRYPTQRTINRRRQSKRGAAAKTFACELRAVSTDRARISGVAYVMCTAIRDCARRMRQLLTMLTIYECCQSRDVQYHSSNNDDTESIMQLTYKREENTRTWGKPHNAKFSANTNYGMRRCIHDFLAKKLCRCTQHCNRTHFQLKS